MPTRASRPLLALGAVLLAVALAGCSAPVTGPVDDPTTTPASTTPSPASGCAAPEAGSEDGPAMLVTSAELLGAADLPDGVCAYVSGSGNSIWLVAQPYDADFPAKIVAWLEPLGWTSEEVGAWGDDEAAESNYSFTGPAGTDIRQSFAHSFESYPEDVSFNFGIGLDFLAQFAPMGGQLAIFTAYR